MTNEELRGLCNTDARQREYQDMEGKPIELDILCKREPAWAANQIRHRDKLEAAVPRLLDDIAARDKVIEEVREFGEYVRRNGYRINDEGGEGGTIWDDIADDIDAILEKARSIK